MNEFHKNAVITAFDEWSETYDSGRLTGWFRKLQQKVIDEIGAKSSDYILDVGCGTGWAVMQLGKRLISGKACGIDLSPGMIKVAKQKISNEQNVEFKVGDAENIPYPNNFFNIVISTSSFHHYPNPMKALNEFKRVLKDNGKVIILDGCRDFFPTKLYDLHRRLFEKGHVKYYSSKEMKEMFNENDIVNITVRYKNQRFFKNGKFYSGYMIVVGEVNK